MDCLPTPNVTIVPLLTSVAAAQSLQHVEGCGAMLLP